MIERTAIFQASELTVGDVGHKFRSITYPNNNKTARPTRHWDRERQVYRILETTWKLETLYAHANGNIKINNHYHLRTDTEIQRVE